MKTLENALRYIVLGGIFLLPFICLIVANSLYFPFITGKNFTFRIIVEIITGSWLALALVYPNYRPRRDWVLGAFSLFVLVMAIADAQGVNPFKSFWSNFERMDGWVTLIHVLAYTLVASVMMNTEKLWRTFFQVSIAVSLFAALYGFLQIAGALTLGEGGVSGLLARIDATFGNPIYLAAYMLFHIFLAAILWAQMRAERSEYQLPLSVFYGGAIIIDTIALLFTGTRGTTLGLIGGAFLALVLFALMPEATKKLRRSVVIAVVSLLVVAGVLFAARETSFVHSVGFLDRLASISLADNTVKARIINAQMAWKGVQERPILGWGQENYAIVFDKYYDPRMYAQEQWFDRVHDIVFDWLVAGGFLGLISYLSIFVAALWSIWRKANAFSSAEKSLLTGLLAGYFFHNLFVFDNITSYILFGSVLAYIVYRSSTVRETKPVVGGALPDIVLPFAAFAAVIVVWGAAWYVNANALAQNRALIQAIQPQSSLSVNLQYFQQAIQYGSYGTQEAREQLIQGAASLAGASNIDTATKQQFASYAAQEIMQQATVSPLDARFPLFLGVLYNTYGDYKDAIGALEKAHQLSPAKQGILFAIAQNQEQSGDAKDALQTYAAAFNLAPDFVTARILYAAVAIRAGQESLADQLLAPIILTGEAADPRIASAYVTRKEYGKIADIWQTYVKVHPSDVQGYFTLAAAYYGAGRSQDAIAALQEAEAISPSITDQASTLIQQIRAGTLKI